MAPKSTWRLWRGCRILWSSFRRYSFLRLDNSTEAVWSLALQEQQVTSAPNLNWGGGLAGSGWGQTSKQPVGGSAQWKRIENVAEEDRSTRSRGADLAAGFALKIMYRMDLTSLARGYLVCTQNDSLLNMCFRCCWTVSPSSLVSIVRDYGTCSLIALGAHLPPFLQEENQAENYCSKIVA